MLTDKRPSLLRLVLPRPSLTFPCASPHTPDSSFSRLRKSSLSSVSRRRISSDSWNSIEDDAEYPWSPEQITILATTLEFLPSHLITPFIGAIPPSNLLDKLARGILDTRTTDEWPHSIRATRLKLLELAKQDLRGSTRPKPAQSSHNVANQSPVHSSSQLRPSPNARIPLYRKNSMDFIPEDHNDMNLDRVSTRLQRSERIVSRAFHPYSRPSSSGSPKTKARSTPASRASSLSRGTPFFGDLHNSPFSLLCTNTGSHLSPSLFPSPQNDKTLITPPRRSMRTRRSSSLCMPSPLSNSSTLLFDTRPATPASTLSHARQGSLPNPARVRLARTVKKSESFTTSRTTQIKRAPSVNTLGSTKEEDDHMIIDLGLVSPLAHPVPVLESPNVSCDSGERRLRSAMKRTKEVVSDDEGYPTTPLPKRATKKTRTSGPITRRIKPAPESPSPADRSSKAKRGSFLGVELTLLPSPAPTPIVLDLPESPRPETPRRLRRVGTTAFRSPPSPISSEDDQGFAAYNQPAKGPRPPRRMVARKISFGSPLVSNRGPSGNRNGLASPFHEGR